MTVTQLFPSPVQTWPLPGLYLNHALRDQAATQPFVYSNFVSSLDGRIAVAADTHARQTVPKLIANARDWRLFQELAVQADVIISSGRYLRDYAAGRAQEILQVYDDARFRDLADWRTAQGLPPQPAIAILSGSLDFPVPAALVANNRQVIIITHRRADPARVQALQRTIPAVVVLPTDTITGHDLVQTLAERGLRTIYSASGPKVLHLLAAAGLLDRLYLTLANRLLGGDSYSTLVEGPRLTPPADMHLHTVYHDAAGLDGLGQLFLSYQRAG